MLHSSHDVVQASALRTRDVELRVSHRSVILLITFTHTEANAQFIQGTVVCSEDVSISASPIIRIQVSGAETVSRADPTMELRGDIEVPMCL